MINYNYVHKSDYDRKIKLGDAVFMGYSKEKLNELYPKGNHRIIGETKKLDQRKQQKQKSDTQKDKRIGSIEVNNRKLDVFKHGTHGDILYANRGYVNVGGDNYVAVKESRLAFLVILFSMLAAIAVCIVLILTMLGKDGGQHGTEHPLPETDPNARPIESTTEPTGEDIDPDTTDTDEPDGPEETDPTEITTDDTDPVEPDDSGDATETTRKSDETTGEEPKETSTPDTTGKPSYPDRPAPEDTTKPSETTKPSITPDETLPPETEKPDSDENKGGGSVSMIYTLDAKLSLKDGKIGVLFQNPNKSTHSVVVELYMVSGDDEYLIARSGLIQKGLGIDVLEFNNSVSLAKGIYKGVYKVLFYDGTTGEKANVNSNIPGVKITVND